MNTKHKNLKPRHMLILIACGLLFLAFIYQQFSSKQGTLHILQQLEPQTLRYEQIEGKYPCYKLWDQEDVFSGYAVNASASGYGGPIDLFVSITLDGTIKNVAIADHHETPAYLKRVLKENYLQKFIGKSVGDEFQQGEDIDTISGATLTTEGIAQAIHKGASQVGANELQIITQPKNIKLFGWQELGLLFFYTISLFALYRKHSKLRPWILLGSVIFLGFLLNFPLSLQNIGSLISGNMPSFLELPLWHLLTLGLLLLTLFVGKNFYCAWLCPFGGLQEGLHKLLSFAKLDVSPRIFEITEWLRWGIIWIVLMAALLTNKPGITGFEPFSVAFGGSGNIGHWLLLCLVILTSILIYRIWCRTFCPIGVVLDFTAKIKRLVKRLIKRPFHHQEHEAPKLCPSCSQSGTHDKLLIVIIGVYGLLILGTVFLNIHAILTS